MKTYSETVTKMGKKHRDLIHHTFLSGFVLFNTRFLVRRKFIRKVKTEKGTEEKKTCKRTKSTVQTTCLRNTVSYQQMLQAGRIPGYVLLPLI